MKGLLLAEQPLHLRAEVISASAPIPLLQLAIQLMDKIAQAGELRLTAKGNLPTKVCKELFELKLIHWPYMHMATIMQEDRIPYLCPLKACLLDEGLIKKRANKLSLTRKGIQSKGEKHQALFTSLWHYFTQRFHWANWFNVPDNGRIGHEGWAYSLWLLGRYGADWRSSDFYYQKLCRALDRDVEEETLKDVGQNVMHSLLGDVYATRFFENFASWFGLIAIDCRKHPTELFQQELFVRKTPFFDELFDVNAP